MIPKRSEKSVYFIAGIDTDIGKTVATGLLAKCLQETGQSVITQKIAQTGCAGISEDILLHRKLMNLDPTRDDYAGITCPYVYKTPCSPHLAAKLEGDSIDLNKIDEATSILNKEYDLVLLEGAGGILVPLTDTATSLDYVAYNQYPVLIVSSNRLGSINHTMLTIEILKQRNVEIAGVIYNQYQNVDKHINEDTRDQIYKALKEIGKENCILDLYDVDDHLKGTRDFSVDIVNNIFNEA